MPATPPADAPAPARARFGRSIRLAAAFTAAYLLAAAVGAVATGNGEFIFYIVVMLVLAAAVLIVHVRVHLSAGAIWMLSIWGALHMAGGLVPVPEGWPVHGQTRVLYSWWIIPAPAPGYGDAIDIAPAAPGGEEALNGYLKYDNVIHAFGFAVTTWVCWQALRAAVGRALRPTLGLMVLCAAAGLGFGALNEVIEFFATLLVPQTNVGGYVNTGWDLVSNTIGAIVAGLLIYLGYRRAADAP